jgi:hypothetical protein
MVNSVCHVFCFRPSSSTISRIIPRSFVGFLIFVFLVSIVATNLRFKNLNLSTGSQLFFRSRRAMVLRKELTLENLY